MYQLSHSLSLCLALFSLCYRYCVWHSAGNPATIRSVQSCTHFAPASCLACYLPLVSWPC
jgi:hypothetical protein